MQSTAIQKTTIAPAPPRARAAVRKEPRRITWAEFERKYLTREDGFKYEWTNGIVEKSTYAMNPNQLYIQFNLQEIFMRLKSAGKVTGQLMAETDLLFSPKIHRRPDFAWLTHAQAVGLAERRDAIEVPAFVIEVVSGHDAAQKIADKMSQYRAAGVQVVWHIYPIQQEVHVYSGENLESMTVCAGEKVCSAAPALPEFAFATAEIFKKTED